MVKHHLRLLATAVVLWAMTGCDRHTSRVASPSDLIGTWRLSKESLALLSADGFAVQPGQTFTLSFAANGSLDFHSVLEHDGKATYHDDAGTWELQHNVTVDNDLKRANCVRVHLTASNDMFPLSVAFEDGRFKLWTFHGDPDEGKYLVYERE